MFHYPNLYDYCRNTLNLRGVYYISLEIITINFWVNLFEWMN